MKTSNEKKADLARKPIKSQALKSKKSLLKDTDAEGSSPYVDLNKANFSERKHGRTTESLGPDHEPGTV